MYVCLCVCLSATGFCHFRGVFCSRGPFLSFPLVADGPFPRLVSALWVGVYGCVCVCGWVSACVCACVIAFFRPNEVGSKRVSASHV